MRPIDADAIGVHILCKNALRSVEGINYADGWNEVVKLINNTPTLDVTPVVHAKFITPPGQHDPREVWVMCSNCCYQTTSGFAHMYDYCPHCGAKIEAEAEHGKADSV